MGQISNFYKRTNCRHLASVYVHKKPTPAYCATENIIGCQKKCFQTVRNERDWGIFCGKFKSGQSRCEFSPMLLLYTA